MFGAVNSDQTLFLGPHSAHLAPSAQPRMLCGDAGRALGDVSTDASVRAPQHSQAGRVLAPGWHSSLLLAAATTRSPRCRPSRSARRRRRRRCQRLRVSCRAGSAAALAAARRAGGRRLGRPARQVPDARRRHIQGGELGVHVIERSERVKAQVVQESRATPRRESAADTRATSPADALQYCTASIVRVDPTRAAAASIWPVQPSIVRVGPSANATYRMVCRGFLLR